MGVQEGYSGVQEKSIKQHNTGILFHIYCYIMYTMNNTTNEHGMIALHAVLSMTQTSPFSHHQAIIALLTLSNTQSSF